MKHFAIQPENPPLTMIGCGILRKEVDRLIEKNHWNIHTQYLDSALHNYFNRLASELNTALTEREKRGEKTVVLYGSCHPLMENFLEDHHTCRTEGQNCIVQLLGYEKFMEELEKGAYFLLEDWALTWEPMITACFGNNVAVVREIFHSGHKYILALRTPCSGDFTEAAQAAADFVELPLRWRDVTLDHLEQVLADAIEQRLSQDP
ncbi:MAG: DUF1638 domain-containing protein [Methylomonas sp.]